MHVEQCRWTAGKGWEHRPPGGLDGEISPFTPNATCELHNQTMTITTLTER